MKAISLLFLLIFGESQAHWRCLCFHSTESKSSLLVSSQLPFTGHWDPSDPLPGQSLRTQGILRCFPSSPDISTQWCCFSTPTSYCCKISLLGVTSLRLMTGMQWEPYTLGFPQTLLGFLWSPIAWGTSGRSTFSGSSNISTAHSPCAHS